MITSENVTEWKLSKYEVFSAPHFPKLGLNTDRYLVSLCIQSECGKIQTRKNSVFGHFSPNWNFKTSMVIALPAPSIIMTHCIRSNIVNIFHVSHISFFFQSTKGSWNKSEKYEKQGKYWSYCTRRRTIANTYHYLYIFQFFPLLLTLQSLLH